jgi:hypothetical protein
MAMARMVCTREYNNNDGGGDDDDDCDDDDDDDDDCDDDDDDYRDDDYRDGMEGGAISPVEMSLRNGRCLIRVSEVGSALWGETPLGEGSHRGTGDMPLAEGSHRGTGYTSPGEASHRGRVEMCRGGARTLERSGGGAEEAVGAGERKGMRRRKGEGVVECALRPTNGEVWHCFRHRAGRARGKGRVR